MVAPPILNICLCLGVLLKFVIVKLYILVDVKVVMLYMLLLLLL